MLYPSINEIGKKADSRYTMVLLAAKKSAPGYHQTAAACPDDRGYR